MTEPHVEASPTPQPVVPTHHAILGRRGRCPISIHRCIGWVLAIALSSGILGSSGTAEEISKQQMQSLDEQVQEIKSDVLGIAAELGRLEERLLYPSNTQVAVFVSLAEGETFRLDSLQIQIDSEPVAHHIYAFAELEALKKGGVQRMYTGNIPTGEHRLNVSFDGKLPGGEDFSETESFGFTKEVEPKLIELTLAGGSGASRIRLGGE